MLTRLPLSLIVELAVDCSTKYSVPSAFTNSGGGFSSGIGSSSALVDQGEFAGRMWAGQGRERSGSVIEGERRGQRNDQFPVLGESQDPAPGLRPEGPAGRV